MSKLFSKVRKEEKQQVEAESNNIPQQQQQDFEAISAQMDALLLQDFQNMALDQFEKLVIVGMFIVGREGEGEINTFTSKSPTHHPYYRNWYIWKSVSCTP